jgi:N-acyl-D-aspartate/D-glutamate deacylase
MGADVEYDLVVRNGEIVDGSGSPRYRGDVGVKDGRIAEIGKITERGTEEIDAEGHVVTPGFIDLHTHMDAQVLWDPLGTCSCYHGVTSVVMGNCGFTLAPAKPDERHLVVRNLERAEDISADAMAQGIEWTWETFPEYLDTLDRIPKGINYAANIGHSAVRTWAMGERAFEEQASDDDMALMTRAVRDAMQAGAIGFTTSRTTNHETTDNRPVASRIASWAEVETLVGAMGEAGGGIFEIAQEPGARSHDPVEREDFCGRLRNLALGTGCTVTFGVLATTRNGDDWKSQLDMIDSTVAAGGQMWAQAHNREFAVLLSWKTRLPFDKLPVWREVRALPLDEQARAFRDPELRARLVQIADEGNYGRNVGAETRPPNYDFMRILEQPLPPNPTVADRARELGRNPVDLMIDLALETNFDQFFVQIIANHNQDHLLEIMKHPRSIVTFSDSGAHVSQIMDSSLQTHLLAHWVREREAFTFEEATRNITSVPANAWNFADRGLVRTGYIADLNVIDPERVAPGMPVAVADLPGGAKRLVQGSVGIRSTIVGGQELLADGKHTGALPGVLLRR